MLRGRGLSEHSSSSIDPLSHLYSKGAKSSSKTWWQLEAESSGHVSSALCKMSSCWSPARCSLRINMMSEVAVYRVLMHPSVIVSSIQLTKLGVVAFGGVSEDRVWD